MNLPEMIATQNELLEALSWAKRVVRCGDNESARVAAAQVEALESTLTWLGAKISDAQAEKLSTQQKFIRVALRACMACLALALLVAALLL